MKILPVYISLVLAVYNTSKAYHLQDFFIAAEAITWYYIAFLQLIILITYELFKKITIYFANGKISN